MLLGRTAERSAVQTVLARGAGGRAGALLLRGGPGAGKTCLLDEARDLAGAAGFRVLGTRGRPGDAEHPGAGLLGLLHPLEAQLARLPPDQAATLEVALGLRSGPEVGPAEVAVATFRLLVLASTTSPLALLVDDVDHLDRTSAAAVGFALARLDADPVVLVATAGEGWASPLLAEAEVIDLGPLDLESLAELVAPLGTVSREVLAECAAVAGGLPLATRELVAGLDPDQRAGARPLPPVLRPSDAVRRGFQDRLARLPEATRRALVVVAADQTGDLGVVHRALLALGESGDGLGPAEDHGLVLVDGDRIAFAHPLLRPVAYHQVGRASARAAHQALAAVLEEPSQAEARAWQLAAAATGPDEAAAFALELVAQASRRRGATRSAAEIWRRAASLSEDAGQRMARLLAAGRAHLDAGEPARARHLLEALRGGGVAPEADLLAAHADRMLDGPAVAGRTLAAVAEGVADPDAASVLRAVAADELAEAGLAVRDAIPSVDGATPRVDGPTPPVDDATSPVDAATARWCAALGGVDAVRPGAPRPAPPELPPATDLLDRRLALRRGQAAVTSGRWAEAEGEVVPLLAALDGTEPLALDLAVCAARARRGGGDLDGAVRLLDGVLARATLLPAPLRDEAERMLVELSGAGPDPDGEAPGTDAAAEALLAALSPAERRVAVAVGAGRTNREAAEALYLSVKTVDYHLQQIYRKLAVRSRAELAVIVTRAQGGRP